MICLHIAATDGRELKWSFGPGSRKNGGSSAVKAIRSALASINAPAKSVAEIGGKNVTISTQSGAYNANNPRPWFVKINGQATAPYRGVDETQPERMAPQPVPQQAYQAVQQARPVQQQPQPMQQPQNFGPAQAQQAVQQAVAQQQQQQYNQVPYADQDIPF